tara:strand:+ start:130 stop:1176 length:1047 start_codon:yes stop_codon:yes gene_type:complete
MKKKSLSAKKTIHKSLLNHLNNKRIKKIFKDFNNYLKNNSIGDKKFGVAISGGPDSLSLAFLIKCYSLKNNITVNFFIVDHKLRKNSSKESKYVKSILEKFDINCKILEWRGKKPKSNIQGIARNNRYDLLKRACKKENTNVLLIAHHSDDLYENFFIRLLRGSGLKGLSSFGEDVKDDKNNILILRPLINFEKEELIYISRKVFDFFIDDPSNQNSDFLRVRLRKLILELKKEGLNKRKINLTIRNLKSANNTVNFYVKKNIEDNATFIKKHNTYILNNFFFEQPEEVLFRSISLILGKISNKYYSPRGKRILKLIISIKSSKANKFTLGGCFVEKINETVLVTREN